MIRRREKDDIGTSKGFMKLFHKTMMFILLPLRKPLIVLPVLIALYAAPTFFGVKPGDVPEWYWKKFSKATSDVGEAVSRQSQKILPEAVKNLELPQVSEIFESEEKAIDRVVDRPVKSVGRQMFERAKTAPDTVDILRQRQVVAENAVVSEKNVLSEKASAAGDTKVQPRKKLALVYVNEPQSVSGLVRVVNANELEINGASLFLYGIYVDPNTQKGIEAMVFLRQIVKGKTVRCQIEAYTYQNIATGICFVDELNINQTMVDKGFSKNVALQ